MVLGVKRVVLVDDAELYGSGLAHLLRRRLPRVGVRVVRSFRLDPNGARGFAPRWLRRVRADAMVFTGITDNGAVPLWRGSRASSALEAGRRRRDRRAGLRA